MVARPAHRNHLRRPGREIDHQRIAPERGQEPAKARLADGRGGVVRQGVKIDGLGLHQRLVDDEPYAMFRIIQQGEGGH